ncbi:hypothetical protein FF011L_24720 [Roseimaritima multifibrata]|uniref:Uncharacterized protein n=1 Tax=Roseimaritima multifibrata TaxID=1930274 RepID=A0A517MFN4_9BACT|nr:hypothetical protein [Roseimaritima multifibrata]QDS93699.1 hypothetical protein FF011L_24720 [Roseimaritima multifibrata]
MSHAKDRLCVYLTFLAFSLGASHVDAVAENPKHEANAGNIYVLPGDAYFHTSVNLGESFKIKTGDWDAPIFCTKRYERLG